MRVEQQTGNVVTLILADHKKVESLLGQVDSVSLSGMEDYFCQLREDLVRHEVAEEMVVYPAFREHVPGGDAIAESCIQEQSLAEEKLAVLEKEDAASESFRSQLKELRQAVLEHAKHEESEVLPALGTTLDVSELESLGQRYEKAIKAAPTHPHPHAPDTPPANKALGPVAALVDRVRDAMRGAA